MGVFNKILFIKEDVGQKENLYLSMMDENHFSTNMLEHIKLVHNFEKCAIENDNKFNPSR